MAERGRPRGFDRDTALRQAMITFWDNGFESTSMTDLTTAMGIASPSIYACFGGKEQLFRAAIERYDSIAGTPFRRALDENPVARDAVGDLLSTCATSFTDPAYPPGCMIVTAGTGAAFGPEVQQYLTGLRRGLQDAIEARLRRAVTEGEIPSSAQVSAIAAFYTTVQQGMSIQARDGATATDLAAVVTAAMAAWEPLAELPG